MVKAVQVGLMTIAVVSVTTLCRPSEADACSADPSPQPERSITPSDEAANVPLNARLVIHHLSTPPEVASRLELRPEGGTSVELDVERDPGFGGELLVALPTTLLLPNTRYEIHLLAIRPGQCAEISPDCFGEGLTVASRFTTSSQTDSNPPVFAGAPTVAEQGQDVCVDCSCDFDWGTALFNFRWPGGASDDSGEVLYDIYADGVLSNRLRKGTASSVVEECWGNHTQSRISPTIAYTAGEYTAVAVDLAGNETVNPLPAVLPLLDCSKIDAFNPMQPSAGCTTANSRGSWLLILSMLTFVVVRRRRHG